MLNFNGHTGRFFLALFFIFLIVVLRYIGIGAYINIEMISLHKEYIKHFISQNYIFSVFIYLLFFSLASFLSIPVTVILNVVAGYFFGVFAGVLYVNIGTTIGSSCSFLAFRYLLSDFVSNRYADKLRELNAHIEEYGASYLLSLQIFPATPTFLINILSGLTSVSVWTFIWTTSLGIFPGSFVYVFAGRQLAKIESVKDILTWPIIIALILLGLLSLIPVFIKRWYGGE